MPRYRFREFTLSPRRRVLLRDGREQPLIPRYFDLLVFLIERRGDAVHRQEIFDRVWGDVVVSDSALTQAVRTIRRVLGDDSREPRFVRTVSRHGYCFVGADVIEEDDDGDWQPAREAVTQAPVATIATAATPPVARSVPAESEHAPDPELDPFEPLLAILCGDPGSTATDEERREAAERLHGLGTSEALRRLDARPRHAHARALLRDTRWDVAGSGDVPILSAPTPVATARALVTLRLRRAARLAAGRWGRASVGAGLAGLAAGATGALILVMVPGTTASLNVVPVLAVLGAACGAAGGAGVGAGLAIAEAVVRSQRTLGLAVGAAAGGLVAGATAQGLGQATLATLVGVSITIGGAFEGLIVGGAAGLGYALATRRIEGGLAAPRGRRRLTGAVVTGVSCGLAGLLLATTGHPLVGGTINAIAQLSDGAQATLVPLGRLVGEPDYGPVTAALVASGEGLLFGLGLFLGLTRRSHSHLT